MRRDHALGTRQHERKLAARRMVSYPGSAQIDAQAQTAGNFSIDRAVLNGVRQASRDTGVDFAYLMAQAAQESGLRADAQAAGSSAKGLYQFIDGTWLQMMRDYGAKYGQGELAAKIQTGTSGMPYVADPATRQQILDLRADPKLSAALGAEFARENKQRLEETLGRTATATDLYMAHFLGAGGATQFLAAIDENGDARAANLLPKAAAANPSVFFDASGRARSVRDIYRDFQARIESKASAFAGFETGGDTPATVAATTRAGTYNAATDVAEAAPDPAASAPAPASSASRMASLAQFASLDANSAPPPRVVNSPYAKPTLSLFSVVALSALELISTQAHKAPVAGAAQGKTRA
ncbi:MAG TPA: hypothetical protein VEU47_13215 [Candidatus Cybelea sp.]|nr:hypothetical protein [Candidatus Cybelea sp.]